MSTSETRTAAAKKSKTSAAPLKRARRQPTTHMAGAEAPTKAYHHGNLRESLLMAAESVLAAHGVQGTTLRDVAKMAGVSHAAPYHHFASLNDLLAAVAERGFVALGDAMERATAQADTRERLLHIATAYVSCARAHPARFRLMFAPQLTQGNAYPALTAASHRAFGILMAAACDHDPIKGQELALCGWSLSHGLSNLLIDGAFDHLPKPVPGTDALVRQLAARALGPL